MGILSVAPGLELASTCHSPDSVYTCLTIISSFREFRIPLIVQMDQEYLSQEAFQSTHLTLVLTRTPHQLPIGLKRFSYPVM